MWKKSYWLLAGLFSLIMTPASATPTQFTFSPGASVLDTLGNHEGLSGTFYYDSATETISNSQILVTGPGPESGQYNGTQLFTFANDPVTGVNVWVLGADINHRVDLFFRVADLNGGAANLYNPGSGFYFVVNSDAAVAFTLYSDSTDGVHGGVVKAVPEPASIALVSLGMFSIGWMRRRHSLRRKFQ